MTHVESRRPGRPRDETIDAAILTATVDELIERGFLGMTMESVAARAGIAKTTLYRRWACSDDLALAAVRTFETEALEPPPGSVRDQLVWLVDTMRRKWAQPRYSAVMRRVTADGNINPEAYRQSRDRLVGPHLNSMNATLNRGVAEGLIRPDVDLGWLRQLLTSPIMAAALTLKDRISRAQLEMTVDIVLRGAHPSAPDVRASAE